MGKHEYAEVISAWANGKKIECATSLHEEGEWLPYDGKSGFPVDEYGITFRYRIKHEPVYPVTQMAGIELRSAYNADLGGPVLDALTRVANAAIRRAIEDGDVILPNKD